MCCLIMDIGLPRDFRGIKFNELRSLIQSSALDSSRESVFKCAIYSMWIILDRCEGCCQDTLNEEG